LRSDTTAGRLEGQHQRINNEGLQKRNGRSVLSPRPSHCPIYLRLFLQHSILGRLRNTVVLKAEVHLHNRREGVPSSPKAEDMNMDIQYKKAKPVSLASLGMDEKWLQKRIAEDPSILGLGDLTVIERERAQPSGGRIDFLM